MIVLKKMTKNKQIRCEYHLELSNELGVHKKENILKQALEKGQTNATIVKLILISATILEFTRKEKIFQTTKMQPVLILS